MKHALLLVVAIAACGTPMRTSPLQRPDGADGAATLAERAPGMDRSLEALETPATKHFLESHDAAAKQSLAGKYAAWLALVGPEVKVARPPSITAVAGDAMFFVAPSDGVDEVHVRTGAETRRLWRSGKGERIDQMIPSSSGRYILCAIARDGFETYEVRVIEASNGREAEPAVGDTLWGILSWTPDESAFVYVREPQDLRSKDPAEAYTRIRSYLHRVGTPSSSDVAIFGFGMPGSSWVSAGYDPHVVFSPESDWVLAYANKGIADASFIAVKPRRELADVAKPWRLLRRPEDGVRSVWLRGDKLVMYTLQGAPRGRLEVAALTTDGLGPAENLEEPSDASLTEVGASRSAAFAVMESPSGGARLVRHELGADRGRTVVSFPPGVSVSDLSTSAFSHLALVRTEGWSTPPRWSVLGQGSRELQPVEPGSEAGRDPGLRVERLVVSSTDGAKFDVTLLLPPTWRAPGPMILTGYGAYGNPHLPRYTAAWRAWFARGGAYAVARVRGGGDYGAQWRLDGKAEKKVNSVLDFIAAAEAIEKAGYATPRSLGVFGWSAGGLLANGIAVRRPELIAAGVVDRGLANPLRLKYGENGPRNMEEFGSPDTKAGLDALFETDAYSLVRTGVDYPAMLYTVGGKDSRLPLWHSAKMVKRLEQATTGKRPILLSVNKNAGHGFNAPADEESDKAAQWYAFFEQHLEGLRP